MNRALRLFGFEIISSFDFINMAEAMLTVQASSKTPRRSDSMDKEKAAEGAVAPEPNKQVKNTGKSTKNQPSIVSDSTLGVVSNIDKEVLLIL